MDGRAISFMTLRAEFGLGSKDEIINPDFSVDPDEERIGNVCC
jgi:hypothetical protein